MSTPNWSDSFMSSPLVNPSAQSPWLMAPSHYNHKRQQHEDNHDKNGAVVSRCFHSLSEKKVYELDDAFQGFPGAWCVGSSKGWLVILDESKNLHLFNPFSRASIQLPRFKRTCIYKAVVVIKKYLPDSSGEKHFSVVMIYGVLPQKLAWYVHGSQTWTDLDCAYEGYCDIISHNDHLYALSDSGSVEVWDLGEEFPKKIRVLQPSWPEWITCVGSYPIEKFCTMFYLVESMGEFLLVVRFRGNFVNRDGVPVDEADIHTDESTQPVVCPYRTLQFRVYKLDACREKWEKVDDHWGFLQKRALFLGGNESVSVSTRDFPECEEASIYFTDDNWDEMNSTDYACENYTYGGHDLGVYNLEKGVTKPVCEQCEYAGKIDPPPFWIVY